MAGSSWVNLTGANGEQTLSGATGVTVKWTSVGLGCANRSNVNPLLVGSIGASTDTPATITISDIPYEMYDVIVYLSTTPSTRPLAPVKVNGTYYTSQEVVKTLGNIQAQSTTAPAHRYAAAWGKGVAGQPAPSLDDNALRVKAQTSKTLTLSVYEGEGRGTIAGVQIVRRSYVPVNGALAWSSIDKTDPLYLDFAPGGQLTGDVSFGAYDIVDVTGDKLSEYTPKTPAITGKLVVDYRTAEFYVPSKAMQLQFSTTYDYPSSGAQLCLFSCSGVYSTSPLMAYFGGGTLVWNWGSTVWWTGEGENNNWNNGANWSTGAVPASGASVLINLEENENLTIDVPAGTSVANVTVTGRGDGSTLTGNLTVTGTFTAQGEVDITQQSGTVSTPALNLDGAIYRIGTGATLAGISGGTTVTETNSGKLIGAGGTLSLTGTANHTIEGDFTLVGASGYTGTLTVSGNVTLAATARPVPTLVKGENATLTVYPASGETSLTIPGGSGFTAEDITVMGVEFGSVTATPNVDNLNLTWKNYYPGVISMSCRTVSNEIPDDDVKHGLFPTAGRVWVEVDGAAGNPIVPPGFESLKSVMTYRFGGWSYNTQTNVSDPILKTFYTDNAYGGVNNFPYERYDVIVYVGSNDATKQFGPVGVTDGTGSTGRYTWDAEKRRTIRGTSQVAGFGRGAHPTPELGVNALRVNNLTDGSHVGLSIKYVAGECAGDANTYFYGFSAMQIIRRTVLKVDKPVSWDVLASGLVADAPVDIEFGPNGQITGDVTLPTDSTVDLTGFDFSQGNRPFAGNLTINDKETLSAGGTIILLPTEAEKYLPANGDLTAPLAGGTVTTTTTPNLSRGGRGCACSTSFAGAGNNPGPSGWAVTRAPFAPGLTRRSSGGSAGRAATVSSTARPDTGRASCATTRRPTFWAARADGSRARFTPVTVCRWCNVSARTSKASCRARPTKPSSPACGWRRATGA